eukprot:11168420-Lingulodinium_polyedra.AAC.1
MVGACKDANCQSPVPGPLDKVTTWIFLTQLDWQILEQMVDRPVDRSDLTIEVRSAIGQARSGSCDRSAILR